MIGGRIATKLLSMVLGPLIRGLTSVITQYLKDKQVEKELDSIRKEKNKIREVGRKLHEAKNLNDQESSKLAADLFNTLDEL